MNNCDLSIIIPVYNAALLINRCLDSIFNQTTSYTFEIICVDDGSTDNSIELIKNRPEENIIIYQQTNSGPAKARNVGLKHSSGRYCAYLDADDYWEQGFIEKSITFLESNSRCVAVNVAQLHKTVSGEFIIPSNYKQFSNPFVLDDFYSFWASYMHVCTGSVTIRTLLLKELGGQREELRITEDLELWALLATKGKWGFIPEQLFVSDGGAINQAYGWKKYIKRFKNIPLFNSWFERLEQRLTPEQINAITPQLNEVVMGITRALISGGDFKRAKENLKFYILTKKKKPYIYKIGQMGWLIWIGFSILYRTYQYLKINYPLIKSKFHA